MTCFVDSSKFSFFRQPGACSGAQEQSNHGDRDGGWCLELNSADFLSPWLLWLLLVQSAQFVRDPEFPKWQHMFGNLASWCQVFILDPFVMEQSLICSHWNTHFFLPLDLPFLLVLPSLRPTEIFCEAVLLLTRLALTFTERELKQRANTYGLTSLDLYAVIWGSWFHTPWFSNFSLRTTLPS